MPRGESGNGSRGPWGRYTAPSPPQWWERRVMWLLVVVCVGVDVLERGRPVLVAWFGF